MDNSVGIRELRKNASGVIRRVREGEVIIVTDHGTPVARIVPTRPGSLSELIEAGLATAPTADLESLLNRVPKEPLSTAGSDALEELRDDRI